MLRLTHRWIQDDPIRERADLTLPYELRQKSRFRARLGDGREVGVFMIRGEVLRDGDQLASDCGLCVSIHAADEEVAVGRPRGELALARACYHLGNRHVPLAISRDCVRFQPDHVLEDMLRDLGVDVTRESAPFDPEGGAYGGHRHEPTHGGESPEEPLGHS